MVGSGSLDKMTFLGLQGRENLVLLSPVNLSFASIYKLLSHSIQFGLSIPDAPQVDISLITGIYGLNPNLN